MSTIKVIEKSDGATFNAKDLKQVFQSINMIMKGAALDMDVPQNIPATQEANSKDGLCYTWASNDSTIKAQLVHTIPASQSIQIASNDDGIIDKIKTTFGHETFKIR